jgi:hypothetical protein
LIWIFLARFEHPNGFYGFGHLEVAQSLELLPTTYNTIINLALIFFPALLDQLHKALKVLGRLCEASNWSSFSQRAVDLLAKDAFKVDSTMARHKAWPILQRVNLHLEIVLPLFGRLLGESGANVFTVQAKLPVFLSKIKPDNLITPILHMIYNPSDERREINESYGLPPTTDMWTWSYVSRFLQLVVSQISLEIDAHRTAEEKGFTLKNSPEDSPMRTHNAKFLAFPLMSQDEEQDLQVALAAVAQHRSGSRHLAFGGSGSGAPSANL